MSQLSLLGGERQIVRCVIMGGADRLDITTASTVYVGCAVHGSGGVMHGDPLRTLARVKRIVEGSGADGREQSGHPLRVYTLLSGERDESVDVMPEDVVSVRLSGGAS